MELPNGIENLPLEKYPPKKIQNSGNLPYSLILTAPHTHIYPPKRLSPEKYGDDHIEEVDFSRRGGLHNPLSPVNTPDFISAPPTPRYNVRGSVHKTFSFGSGGRTRRTEEETIGLVEAGRNEEVCLMIMMTRVLLRRILSRQKRVIMRDRMLV